MARPRLTRHQREVLDELIRMGTPKPRPDGPYAWVSLERIRARSACIHLVEKGYAERLMRYGPRGGERPYYRAL